LRRCRLRWYQRYPTGGIEDFFAFITDENLPEEEHRWGVTHYVLPPRFTLPPLRGGNRYAKDHDRFVNAVKDFDLLLPCLQKRRLKGLRSASDQVRKTRISAALKEAWGDDILDGLPKEKLSRWGSVSRPLSPRKIALEASAWKHGLRSTNYLEKQLPKIREELQIDEKVFLPILLYSRHIEEKEDGTVRTLNQMLRKKLTTRFPAK
jgi:hypothetical protein